MKDDIRGIPIDSIAVLNSRSRNKRLFIAIAAKIVDLGLIRPVVVIAASDGKYDLVCGQPRLEAYRALGATTIPAIIISTTEAA